MARWRRPVDPDVESRQGARWQPVTLLLVALGGASGTAARSGIESAYPALPGGWPWATFWINVSGALVLGVLLETLALLGPDDRWRRRARLGLGTGVLGGFTTYSSFMVETATLARDGWYVLALGYDFVSLLIGFGAAYVGAVVVSRLHRRVYLQRLEET